MTVLSTIGIITGVITLITLFVTYMYKLFNYLKTNDDKFEVLDAKITSHIEDLTKNINTNKDTIINTFEPNVNLIKKNLDYVLIEMAFHSTAVKQIDNFENSGWWRSDEQGETIQVSDRLTRLLGYSEDKFLGLGWLDFVHKGDRTRLVKAFKSALINKENFNEDFRWRTPDNKYINVNSYTKPVAIGHKIVSYYGVMTLLTKNNTTIN